MKTTELPLGIQEFLAGCPKAGNGVHRWLFSAALWLHRGRVPSSDAAILLAEATATCGRTVAAREIEEAVLSSERSLRDGGQAERRTPKWPSPNQEQIEAIALSGPRFAELREMSPVKWTDGKSHSEAIIDVLFPGNPLLCVGQSKYRFNTMPRELWRGRLAAREFIVPSPMSKVLGVKRDGGSSKHTLDNTGPRRFLVIEFDTGPFDQHAALLIHLAKFAPFVMAVHSGNKSIHGWFYCERQEDEKLLRFMRYAISLGADPATFLKSQFVRLPDGRRENGKLQTAVYFNPQRVNIHE